MIASPWFGMSLILLLAGCLWLAASLPARTNDVCSAHAGASTSLAAVAIGCSPAVLA